MKYPKSLKRRWRKKKQIAQKVIPKKYSFGTVSLHFQPPILFYSATIFAIFFIRIWKRSIDA